MSMQTGEIKLFQILKIYRTSFYGHNFSDDALVDGKLFEQGNTIYNKIGDDIWRPQ